MSRTRLSAEALEPRATPTTLPSGFIEASVASGINRPTAMTLAPDGRSFVAEQGGQLRVVRDGQLLGVPFVSLTVDSSGERGLLGVALDPSFTTNNFVYVYYTVPAGGGQPAFNRVSRFTAAGDNAQTGSELVLVNLEPLSGATNHNGGAIHFGADGKLYVAVGENSNSANSQSLTTRLGKILRYNPDGSIPADNPTTFAGLTGTTTGANKAIWAVGLRNPFTFAILPGTNRLFINDVGQSAFEEVNEGGAGKNYGWPTTEGDFDQSKFPYFTRPAFNYGHGSGNDSGFVIAGAVFYNPTSPSFPADYVGDYFFAEFANDWIRRYDTTTKTAQLFATELTVGGLVDINVTPQGDLLYLSRGNSGASDGRITRITFTQAPQIVQQPVNVTVGPGGSPTFTVVASGTAPLTYQWQRNGIDIPGATGSIFTLTNAQLTENGATFRVVVRNDSGTVTSNEATLTVSENVVPVPIAVSAAGRPPVVRTLNPTDGTELGRFDLGLVTLLPPGFTAEARAVSADVTGDGVTDLIVGAGPGNPSYVVVYDGKTGGVITTPTIFESSFTGGVFVAAGDIDGDGTADVIVTPDEGGGPRVHVFRVDRVNTVIVNTTLADYFGIEDLEFRGGARAAAGDMNGDGRADLLIAAGFGGGPRVAVWDGREVASGNFVKVVADFFVFEQTLRNGVFIAAGDLDGDSRTDAILGGGPGGGPRVLVLSGRDLIAGNRQTVLGNFFAGDPTSRDGVRVAVKDIDANGQPDIVAGVAGRVRMYVGQGLPQIGVATPLRDVAAAEDGFTGAVFVG